MIIQGAFTYPVALNGTPLWSPWVRPVSLKTWYGVRGALSLVGALQTRDCTVEATLTNFATLALFETAHQYMVDQLDNVLTGTLSIDDILYPRCLFLGWEPSAPAFYDGSGLHGWTQFGRLKWQQTR